MSDTSAVSIPLDVVAKYESLVKESLDGESVYIRAKETLVQLFEEGDINSTDKASAISNVVGSMVNGITSSSMATALEWAKYEKELALKKLELDQQLLIQNQELLLKTAQVKQVEDQTRIALIESRRMHGVATFDVASGAVISLTETGKVWNDMLLVTQQTTNAVVEKELLDSKVLESAAAIHKVVADTYTNFGTFTYSYDPSGDGFSSITRVDPSNVTLSDTQQQIAIEQGKGYTYNAWANSLTGSASMLGTAIASGDFSFNPGSNELKLFDAVVKCAENLSVASSAADEAIPA